MEPWLSRLELEAQARLYLDESDLWPADGFITTLLVCSKRFMKQEPEALKRLIAAHIEVTQMINSDKDKASKIINDQIRGETGGSLPPAVMSKAMHRVTFTWSPAKSSLLRVAEHTLKVGLLKELPDLSGIFALDDLATTLSEKHLPMGPE